MKRLLWLLLIIPLGMFAQSFTRTAAFIGAARTIATGVADPAAIIGFTVHSSTNYTGNVATFLTTPAATFQANSLALVAIVASDTAENFPTSVTGCGMTWVNVMNNTYNTTWSISLWRSMTNATSPSGGLTVTFPENRTGCNMSAMEFTNVNTSGTYGSGAVGQVVIGTNTTAPALTMAALVAGATNAVFALFGTVSNSTDMGAIEGGYWVEQFDNGYNTPATGLYCEYALRGTDLTIDPSIDAQAWGGIAIEINASGSDTTAPLLLATSSVDTTGTNWLLKFNENVYTNASLAGLVAPSNSALGTITNLTFVTGSGSNALHFYNSPQITSNGVVTYVSFTNAANAIEDLAGNDLASTNVVSVVNNSTIGGANRPGVENTKTNSSRGTLVTSTVITNGGDNRLQVVHTAVGDPGQNTVISVTNQAGTVFTKLYATNAPAWARAEMWYLYAPPAGSNTVHVIIDTTTDDLIVNVMNVTNAHQSAAFGTAGTASGAGNLSVTISSSSTGLVVGGLATDDQSTAGISNGGTSIGAVVVNADTLGVAGWWAGAASVSASFTNAADGSIGAVNIVPP